MQKILKIAALSVVIIFCSSCKKKGNISSYIIDNSETILYKKTSSSNESNVLIGANVNIISKISFTNQILDKIKNSKEWAELNAKNNTDLLNITKTSYTNSPLQVITIPIAKSQN